MSTPIRGILLDIEGTTSSISFVYDVMFPYVRTHLNQFLRDRWDSAELNLCLKQLARDVGQPDLDTWLKGQGPEVSRNLIEQAVLGLMDVDDKRSGLKQLQGLIWESGFASGQLVGHLYDEVGDCIQAWASAGLDVRIYSSGSVAAQKLFFGHSRAGNLLRFLSGHYDTQVGGKQAPESYQKISIEFGIPPTQILFVSDVVAELAAASQAGMQTRLSLRPGNKPVPADHGFQTVTDFRQISLA